MEYVIIYGRAPSHLGGKLDADLREYVAGIVYGTPERIFGTLTDGGYFVALVEYEGEVSGGLSDAGHTFKRIPSFNYGAQYTLDVNIAFREFGTWVAHYSGPLKPSEDKLVAGVNRAHDLVEAALDRTP